MNEAKDAQTKFVQGNIIDKDQPIKEQNQQLQQQQGVQQQKPIEESKQQDLTQSQLKQLLQQPPQQEEQKQEQITIKVQEQGEFTDLQKVFNEHDDIAKIYGSLFIKETIQEQAGKEQFAKSLEALRQAVYSAYPQQQQQSYGQIQILDQKIQDKNKIKTDAQTEAQKILAVMAQALQARGIGQKAGVNVGDILCGPDVSTVLLTTEMKGFSSKDNRTASGTWPTTKNNAARTMEIVVRPEDIADVTEELVTEEGESIKITKSQLTKERAAKLKDGFSQCKQGDQLTVAIEAHGALLENAKSAKGQNDMQFIFAEKTVENEGVKSVEPISIPASQLFSNIEELRPQDKPLLVITTACYGGQARNDVAQLGSNAALITFPGRKYEGQNMYNLSGIPQKTDAELKHMGLSSWVRDCVLHGVKFNIALTNEEGKQIFWYKDKQQEGKEEIITLDGNSFKTPNKTNFELDKMLVDTSEYYDRFST